VKAADDESQDWKCEQDGKSLKMQRKLSFRSVKIMKNNLNSKLIFISTALPTTSKRPNFAIS
jgi:hypothetical protein